MTSREGDDEGREGRDRVGGNRSDGMSLGAW